MRIKLGLLDQQGAERAVTVVTNPLSTIGDVARALAGTEPDAVPGGDAHATLRIHSRGRFRQNRLLDPAGLVADSTLQSGESVELVTVDEAALASAAVRDAAVLRVLDGPDAGAEIPLALGASTIGRDRSMTVRLTDPLVSKRHARVIVGEAVEIIDSNSANGVLIGGVPVQRAVLESSDIAVVGGTSICVIPLRQVMGEDAPSAVDFVRSPRVVARFEERTFKSPTPPKRPDPEPFPVVMLIAPLVMGMVLFLVTRQFASVIFTALTPLLAIGIWIDRKIRTRSTLRAQRKQFAAGLVALEELVTEVQRVERAVRQAESPSLDDAVTAARQLGPMMWTHRPEHPGFLTVRLGLGTAASRCSIELPQENDTLPEYWQQAAAVAQRFATIDAVPIRVDFRVSGNLGIAGPREARADAARAVAMELAAFHSPAEVAIAAIASPTSRPDWDWMQWLPHTTTAHSPLPGPHLVSAPGAVDDLVARLEGLVAARSEAAPALRGPLNPREPGEVPAPVVPALVIFVENDAGFDRAKLIRIAERGPDHGVHLVWCGTTLSRIPAAARSFLVVGSDDSTTGQVRFGEHSFPVATQSASVEVAEALAREMSPVLDVSAMLEDQSDLPGAVSYAALSGTELLSDARFVEERWRENHSIADRSGAPAVPRRSASALRALVGATGADAFTLDLRRDGPHALVGGTTGSGKSEFLQAWVLGLATAYGPDRVTFLFVDYKGGSAFADCLQLPHTVGLVTDLSPHLVRRALTSLRAELRYREQLLHRKRAKDLVSLEASGDPDAPPSLVIVVDEFAALVQEVPEFVDGVVDVAQRGRSLGLHLILATQRPAGVIKDNLRANTNLRVALRMADADDSTDVIGDALAYEFSAEIPGRAAAKTGSGSPTIFQAAYAGGWTAEVAAAAPVVVDGLGFDSSLTWEVQTEAGEVDTGPNDVTRIVRTVVQAGKQAAVPAPRRPWLDELAPTYDFARLPQPRTDADLLLGVVDRPAEQAQPTCFYRPDRDGNMAIFGTGGAGKSAALRSIAIAAAVTPRGGPVHVYGLDFGARGLAMLEPLPHVGAIVDGEDDERVVRLIKTLHAMVDERAERYAAARASTIVEYRLLAERPDEPRVLLLIDNLGQFREQYEFTGTGQLFSALTQIATDGRQVGVHVVVTADRPNALPPSLGSTIQRRLVLRMPTEDDYLMLNVPRDVLDLASPPGRGVLDGDEVQLCVLGGDPNVAVQAREVQHLADELTRQGVSVAPAVQRLPAHVPALDLPVGSADAVVIGMTDEALEPATVRPAGAFMIAGPAGSGRSTALEALTMGIRRADPGRSFVLFEPRRSGLAGLLQPALHRVGATEVGDAAAELHDRVENGEAPPVLVLPSVTDFNATEAEFPLDRLIRVVAREGGFVIGESETSVWGQYSAVVQAFKGAKTGLLLAPGEMDGDLLFGTGTGRVRRADFPPGRGFLIGRGRATKIQVAVPSGDFSPSTPSDAVVSV